MVLNFLGNFKRFYYTRRTLLATNGINFILKIDNPPNVPQARPIKEVWSHLSRKVYDGG